jgi:hypothetical protein
MVTSRILRTFAGTRAPSSNRQMIFQIPRVDARRKLPVSHRCLRRLDLEKGGSEKLF